MATETERHIVEVGIRGADSAINELASISAAAMKSLRSIADALDSLAAFKTITIKVNGTEAMRQISTLRQKLHQSIVEPLSRAPLMIGMRNGPDPIRSRAARFGWRRRKHNARAQWLANRRRLEDIFYDSGVPLLGMSDTENFTNTDLDKLYRLKELKRKLREHREILRNAIVPIGGGGDGGGPPTRFTSVGFVNPGNDTIDADYTIHGNSGGGGPPISGNGSRFGSFIGNALGALSRTFMRFSIAMGVIQRLVRPFRRLINEIARLNGTIRENFKLYKDSLRAGILSGGDARYLKAQQRMNVLLGGDAASISALNKRIAAEKAMIAFGGRGGSFMEAARLFGVNIFGSGKYGFATNEEFMMNIAKRMSQLDENGKIALANTMGLTDEQFWALRGGEELFKSYLASSKTQLESARELSKVFEAISTSASSAFHGVVMEETTIAFNKLIESLKETGLILGDALLPYIYTLCDILSETIQLFNAILSPVAKFLGYIGRFFNYSVNKASLGRSIINDINNASAEANKAVGNTPAKFTSYDHMRGNDAIGGNTSNRNITISNLTVNARTPEEAKDFTNGAVSGISGMDYDLFNNGMAGVA